MAVVRMKLGDSDFEGNASSLSKKDRDISTRNVLSFSSSSKSFNTVKKTSKPKKKAFSKVLVFVIVFILMGLVVFKTKAWDFVKNTSSAVSEVIPVLPAIQPELKKDELGRTNVMLVGIDTRESGQLELNTDTIILASYDENTHRLSMLSFPRDLALTYPTSGYIGRINGIYASAENQKKGSGLETVKSVLEDITNTEIHYYAMVDLKGFTDTIDTIGGINVYLDHDISGDYPVSGKNIRVDFKAGWNTFSGSRALQYSRIRKNVVPYEDGNDFARARRQQQVIQAAIEKISKSDTLLNPQKAFGLLDVATDNVTLSKFTLEDVQAGISILKDNGKPEMFTYVLDPDAGGTYGRLINVTSLNPWLIGPRIGYDNWGEIQQLVKVYLEEPLLPTMDKKIRVLNSGNTDFTSKFNALKTRYYFADIEKGTEAPIELAGKVYVLGGTRYDPLGSYLAGKLGLEVGTDDPELFSAGDWGDVAVVVIF